MKRPRHVENFTDINEFKGWLVDLGGTISPQKPHEVVRVKGVNHRCMVLYHRGGGAITWTDEWCKAYDAYIQGVNFNGLVNVVGKTSNNNRLQRTIDRDGVDCFYCGEPTNEHNRTLEHLLNKCNGGRNVAANLAVAHTSCNQQAGNGSVVDKVKFRDACRLEKETKQHQTWFDKLKMWSKVL